MTSLALASTQQSPTLQSFQGVFSYSIVHILEEAPHPNDRLPLMFHFLSPRAMSWSLLYTSDIFFNS